MLILTAFRAKTGVGSREKKSGNQVETQQAELQTTENRYSEVKMWLDSFAEHIQSGDIMNADDSMIMKPLVEQIIVGYDGIEVHFK